MLYLKKVLALPYVQRVEVTTAEIRVTRQVRDGEPVVPEDLVVEAAVDVGALVKRIQPEQYPFRPDEHPYFCLEGATRTITERKLFVTHILAPEGEWLSAWMGLDYVPVQGARVLGMKIVYSDSDLLDGRIVLLGSASSAGLLADTLHGVVIDLNAS
jgi:hypothetical protein